MISSDYARWMARYNRWQNRSLFAAAEGLDEAARRADRAAFFGSIHGTLNHVLWADQMWMRRFAETPAPRKGSIPESVDLHDDWAELCAERARFDGVIAEWAEGLSDAHLAGDLNYFSGVLQRQVSKPLWVCVTHMFNHQTHHRGQVHAMLTAAGATPDDTDLFVMPEDA